MSVSTLCSKNYLYTPLDEDGKRDMSLEEDFTKMESCAANYWSDFAAGTYGLESDEQKSEVSLFLAALHLRNKRIFDLCASAMKNRDQLFGGPIVKAADGTKRLARPFENNPDPTDPSRYFSQSTRKGIGRIADIFKSYGWAIFHTDGDLLLTSDTPIVFFDHEARQSGPGRKGAHAIFPISPSSILFMQDENKGAPKPILITDLKRIGFFNRLIYMNAERFVVLNVDPRRDHE